MASSGNTFGTFLQTFSTLERQSPGSNAPSGASVAGIVRDLAKRGNRSALKDLVAASNLPKEELLSTVMDGKRQGLIDISEEQGEPIANLTGLGKFFVS